MVEIWYTKFVNNFHVAVQICTIEISLWRLRDNSQISLYCLYSFEFEPITNFATVVIFTAVKFSEMKRLTGGRADENTARNERIIIQWLSFDTRDNTNVR